MKAEAEKKQDVLTLSDSDDVQTISSGSDDNKEKEKVPLGKNATVAMTSFRFVLCIHAVLPLVGFRGD